MSTPRVRWVVEWQELTPYAQRRKREEDDGGDIYEHDRDRDERNVSEVFSAQPYALACARKKVRSGVTVYGHATIQKEVYLPIAGTVHFDWEPDGDPEYVEGRG